MKSFPKPLSHLGLDTIHPKSQKFALLSSVTGRYIYIYIYGCRHIAQSERDLPPAFRPCGFGSMETTPVYPLVRPAPDLLSHRSSFVASAPPADAHAHAGGVPGLTSGLRFPAVGRSLMVTQPLGSQRRGRAWQTKVMWKSGLDPFQVSRMVWKSSSPEVLNSLRVQVQVSDCLAAWRLHRSSL